MRLDVGFGRALCYFCQVLENFLVVELLLQHNANPRIEGMEFTKSAMDEIKVDLESPGSKRL